MSNEELQAYWDGKMAECKAEPVLTSAVDEELTGMIRVLEVLRSGGPIQFRQRGCAVACSWSDFQLNLTDGLTKCRMNFAKFETRVPPEAKDITVWVAIAPSGRVIKTFTDQSQAEEYASENRWCMNIRIITLCATVEVL